MPERTNSNVHGSVIQRSLVPRSLRAVLHVATVPVDDLDPTGLNDSRKSFRDLVSRVLGIPGESIVDETQYAKLLNILRDGTLWEELAHRAHTPLFHELYYYWRHELGRLAEERLGDASRTIPEENTVLLAMHSLSLMLSPTRTAGPFWASPSGFGSFPATAIPRIEKLRLNDETFDLGIQCFFSAIYADKRVRNFGQEIEHYDIPSGQSPAAKTESLLTIIETSKKVCLAPLAVGGSTALAQLTQGNYVSALLCSGTASAMTLILIGTLSVADYLIHYLLHKRNELGESTPDNTPLKQQRYRAAGAG
jgi:hypothetical protein